VAVESIKEITLAPDGTKVYTDYTKAYNTTAGAVYLINGWNVDATYEVVYSYDASTTTLPTVKYSYPTNLKAQVESNANEIQQNAKDIDDLNDFTISQLISLNSATAKNRVIMIPLGNISATASQIAFIANTAGKITNVYMSTGVAITASDTDYWQIDLINKGTDGSKTDVFCTMTTKTTGGSGFTAYTAKFVGELTSKANLVQWGVVKLTLTKTGNPTAFSEAVLMLEWLPTF
jgi:hypothetical protein